MHNQLPIKMKPLSRTSSGNCIVNNTIWKDLEVWALKDEKILKKNSLIK